MPSEYLPILVFIMIATAFGFGALLIGYIFRPSKPYFEKLLPYESGMTPVGEPRYRFSLRFYIIVMMFLVFDVEAIFMYPWAIVFDDVGMFGFIGMVVFIAMILVGYAFDWKKESFKWD